MKETKLIPSDSISIFDDFNRTTTDPQADADLLSSIRQLGIIHPLIVLQSQDKYILISGYRRYFAARELGLPTIPCITISGGIDDAEIMRLHENLFRLDISPLEEAVSLARLEHTYHFTREKISKMIGKSKAYVTQRIQILGYPGPLKDALAHNALSFSIARELSDVTDIPHLVSLISLCIQSGATVRTVAGWVADWKSSRPSPQESPQESPHASFDNISHSSKDSCFICSHTSDISPLKSILLCNDCLVTLQNFLSYSPTTPPDSTPNPDTPNTSPPNTPDPPNPHNPQASP
jgi:ParB/RepB/Spo0J family partition protein